MKMTALCFLKCSIYPSRSIRIFLLEQHRVCDGPRCEVDG